MELSVSLQNHARANRVLGNGGINREGKIQGCVYLQSAPCLIANIQQVRNVASLTLAVSPSSPATASSSARRANILPRIDRTPNSVPSSPPRARSEEDTSELQSLRHLVCRLLLEKK